MSSRPNPPPAGANDGNGGGSAPPPSVQSARDYVARVKRALGGDSAGYRAFLDALKGYRTRAITPLEVIRRVEELLRGRDGLILGFNAFLPAEYHIRGAARVPGGARPGPEPRGYARDGAGGQVRQMHEIREVRVERPAAVIVEEEPSADEEGREEEEEEEHEQEDEDRKPSAVEKAAMPSSQSRRKSKSYEDMSDDEDEEEDEGDDGDRDHCNDRRRAMAQDPPQPRRKRRRVRVPSRYGTKPPASFATPVKATPKIPPPPKKKIDPSTRILLSPPKLTSADVLHDYNPIEDGEFTETIIGTDHVSCKLCGGERDARALARNEPVLLCEQRGCNAEFHLGCLYDVRPGLFPEKGEEGNDANPNDGEDMQMEEGRCELAVPEGDIFCATCHSDGATSVLRKYFDKIDYERSHYSCSRAYIYSLLEKHMKLNPDGNVVERSLAQEKAGMGEVRLKCPPRSELWYAQESNRQALGKEEGDGDARRSPAELVIGKPVRLYNNLDNEYHVGRIVDWRACTVYPPLYAGNDGPPVSKNNAVQMNDLEHYGTGPISTAEYLVRFPSGLQGRRKELLRWILLEEHSLAVGVSLIKGKTSKTAVGSCGGWKPAVVLARSTLELVTVRQFLHEDSDGNLFADAKVGGGKAQRGDRWALASFFGDDQHALLNLREEARDLLEDFGTAKLDDASTRPATSADAPGGRGDAETSNKETEEGVQQSPSKEKDGEGKENNTSPILVRGSSADMDVTLGLALAEHGEQRRCREWSRLILEKSAHKLALAASDEYSAQLALERGAGRAEARNVNPESAESTGGSMSGNGVRPLVERGMDRLWLARLVEKVSSRPIRRSKDTLMSFKCERVTSVSAAMASLNRCQ